MPTAFLRGNRIALLSTTALVFCLTALGIWYVLKPLQPAHDALLTTTFEGIASVLTYAQDVETTVSIADKTLRVSGRYILNGPENKFSSHATTSLFAPKGTSPQQSEFTLENITIGNTMYVKIETRDPGLQKTISHSAQWRQFDKNRIPEDLTNIAVWGPVLDNLLLLQNRGIYLELIESLGSSTWGKESLEKYTFRLSPAVPSELGGTLGSLVTRIGKTGTVELWIDKSSTQVRHMVFHGEGYHSTTTISAINIPQVIEAPLP